MKSLFFALLVSLFSSAVLASPYADTHEPEVMRDGQCVGGLTKISCETRNDASGTYWMDLQFPSFWTDCQMAARIYMQYGSWKTFTFIESDARYFRARSRMNALIGRLALLPKCSHK